MRSRFILVAATAAVFAGLAAWLFLPPSFDREAWLAAQPVDGVQTEDQNAAFCALRGPAARVVAGKSLTATLALLGPPSRDYTVESDQPPHQRAGDRCLDYSGLPCEFMSTSVSGLTVCFVPDGVARPARIWN